MKTQTFGERSTAIGGERQSTNPGNVRGSSDWAEARQGIQGSWDSERDGVPQNVERVWLEGSTLRPDENANRKVYGSDATAAKIITDSKYEAPGGGKKLVDRLQKAGPQLKA